MPGDAPLEPVPGDSRRYKDIPAGPYDPRRPLPWDKYEYPATPPPPRMPLAQRLEKKAAEYYLKWWRGLPDEEGELPELPPGETRPVLPSRGISSRASGLAGSFGLTRADVPTDQVWRELNDTKAVTFREHITSWVKKLYGPSPLELLDQYLRAAGIRHFSAKELTIHKWDGVRAARKTTPPNAWRQYRGKTFDGAAWSFVLDTFGADLFPKTALLLMPRYIVPPPEMWPRIIPALRILDRFREYLGQPVRGISGYRHPAYNTMIQGSEDSFHMSFSAVDFTYRIRLPDDRIDTSVFFNWFNHLYRARGDGTGAYRSFVHLDVGHSRHLIKGKSQQWRRPKDLDDVVPLPPRFR